MAGTNQTAQTGAFALNSHDTALCIIPPQSQCNHIEQLRSVYDKGYGKWPPHINLLYPFVALENLHQAKSQIKFHLHEQPIAPSLSVKLNQAGCFLQRTHSTIFLCEHQSSQRTALDAIYQSILECLGKSARQSTLHLTVGQSEDKSTSSIDFLLSKAKLLPSLEFQIGSLAILVRESNAAQTKISNRMRLWGTIDLSDDVKAQSPLSEFWISPSETFNADQSTDEDADVDALEEYDSVASSYVQGQPETTYQFNTDAQLWQPCKGFLHQETPTDLAVSSYNVLVDSEYPPERERDPLLLRTILSNSALADVLVLQEVSDDFLSFILADKAVRSHYPFTTHGPPNQEDIGPLPSLRNVVILSKWHLTWEFVPFQRRHKGAVVVTLDTLRKDGNSGFPLVVAGVHLTCGLTDGSVAAKKIQLSSLKNYLTRKHSKNPWVIAGDFNIATSSFTVETALKNKSISQQTSNTLASMENMMTDAGLLDAWSIAKLQAMDGASWRSSDDLFEGEEGATFDPRENELAATTSGTSNNRPQRYDRIMFRCEELLRLKSFNHFGLPQDHDGFQVVPSDHYGVRATMNVSTTAPKDSPASQDLLQANAISLKQANSAMADLSSMTSVLDAHGMFPSDEESAQRKKAFDQIKEVILGSTNEEQTSASDIPLVIVPVGSYALGVWTLASDIDCLCIGSISSKTFFKLACQRINRAEEKGVRLIRKVEANTGTMLELSVDGVYMDLQYCPAARIVERWSDLPDLNHFDPIFNLSMLSLRKLKPYRDIQYIQRTLPSLSTFRLAYRCIKLWAVQRGIYSSKFGYLGGIHITLMLSWVYKRVAHEQGNVSAANLVATFFHHYANFDWKNNTVFDAFFYKKLPTYHRTAREPMVVLGFHSPNANVAHTSTVPGLQTLVKEMQEADQRLSQQGMTWDRFFGSHTPSSGKLSDGASDFLHAHDGYAQITIQYWGRSLSKGKGLLGWVESRCLLLVVDINRILPNLTVRIWPARFTDDRGSDSGSDYQGFYLIGLSRDADSNAQSSKEDRTLAAQELQKAFNKFQDQIQADETSYDASTSWVGVSLVKSAQVQKLQLDTREWGDYIPDIEADSDDEDEPEDEVEAPSAPTSQKRPQRSLPSSTPVSSSKLRPASDVLHRLRWDANLDPSDYIVGYEDRFLGAKETTLERWKTEQTDDEFIPQHRILYFKRRTDGVVVWERRTRIDLVFGSGAGAGDAN